LRLSQFNGDIENVGGHPRLREFVFQLLGSLLNLLETLFESQNGVDCLISKIIGATCGRVNNRWKRWCREWTNVETALSGP
jgi:hypothetical protein